MRSNRTLYFMLGDHLGSTSITTDANGAKVSEMRYKPCPLHYVSGMLRESEVRLWRTAGLTTTPAYKLAATFSKVTASFVTRSPTHAWR